MVAILQRYSYRIFTEILTPVQVCINASRPEPTASRIRDTASLSLRTHPPHTHAVKCLISCAVTLIAVPWRRADLT